MSIKASLLRVLLLAGLCICGAVRAEGIGFDLTRAVIAPERTESSLVFKNDTDWAYLLVSHLETPDGEKVRDGVMLVPPIAKIMPRTGARLRILVSDPSKFPQDRETLLWLVSKAVPASTEAKNALQINFVNKLKVFYRPKGLKGNSIEAMKQVKVIRQGDRLVVKNESAFVISMGTYFVDEKSIDTSDVIFPFSQLVLEKLDIPQKPFRFGWIALDESGLFVRNNADVK